MRIQVDTDACTGHAQCAMNGPDVYEIDDDGYCAVNDLEVPAGLEGQARDGADSCPERAITLVD